MSDHVYLPEKNWFKKRYLSNPFTLRVPLESIVCYSHASERNSGIKQKCTKYLKESCCAAYSKHFSYKCFLKKYLRKLNISKIARPVSEALSVNG